MENFEFEDNEFLENIDSHFYTLYQFIEDNEFDNFKEYINKILSYKNGKKILLEIYWYDRGVDICGSECYDYDDGYIKNIEPLLYEAIKNLRYDFITFMIENYYPLDDDPYDYPLIFIIEECFNNRYTNQVDNLLKSFLVMYKPSSYIYQKIENRYNKSYENAFDYIDKIFDKIKPNPLNDKNDIKDKMISIFNENIEKDKKSCWGCNEDQPNQMAHMDYGGCLYDENEFM